MRRFYGTVLFFCLVLPFLGLMGWLTVQKKMVRKQIKHEIIAGIDKSELVLLSFSKEEAQNLKWKHSKEFEYKGSMYDIVETLEGKDSISYWCWWDHEETLLNKQLKELTADVFSKDPVKKEKQNQLISFLKTFFIEPALDESFHSSLSINYSHPARTVAFSGFIFIDSPPPQA